MAKSITKATVARINLAHTQQPYYLGPLLGVTIVHAGLPPTYIARMLKVQPVTLMQWLTGEREVPASHTEHVGVLLGVLCWLYGKRSKVSGELAEVRAERLESYLKSYGLLA